MGLGELIVILLSLSGLGVQPNPNAPSADEIARYAPSDADVLVHLDLEAVAPGNWKVLTAMPNDPTIQRMPDVRAGASEVVRQAEAGRAEVHRTLGFDPVNDVKWAAIWISVPAKGDPAVLATVKGAFPADLADRIAALEGGDTRIETVEGRPMLVGDGGRMGLGLAPDGMLLAGTTGLVRPRLAARWRPGRASALAKRLGPLFAVKPFFVVASRPSPKALKRFEGELGGDPDAAFVRDFLTGHEYAALAMTATGLGWEYRALTAGGYERALDASEGVISLLRAAHHGTRAFALLAMAILPSYGASDASIAQVVKNRAALLRLLDSFSGDGQFEASVIKDPSQRLVSVKAIGKKLSDVVPLGGLLPGAGAAFFLLRGGGSSAVHGPVSAPAPVAAPPSPRPRRP